MADPEQLDHPRQPPSGARPAGTRSIGAVLVSLLLVPLVALVGLWAFLASSTLGNAVTEHSYNRSVSSATQTSNELLAGLEQERLQAFLWLSAARRPPASQLAAARRADDAAIAAYTRIDAAGTAAQQALGRQLRKVPGIRSGTDSGSLSAPAAFQAYSTLIDAVFDVFISTGESDVSLYRQTLAAIEAGRALEQVTREVTLVAGAELDRGQLSSGSRQLFATAVATQHLLVSDALAESSVTLGASLRRLYRSPLAGQLAALESQIDAGPGSRVLPPATLRAWGPASAAFLGRMLAVTKGDAGPLGALAGRIGNRLFLEAALAGGLGLLAVVGSLILMVAMGRGIRRELTSLHDGAETMAHERLPRVMERLGAGDEVDVEAESPPLAAGRIHEIARVAHAFSTVQRTAVTAAVGQARLRRGVNQVFLNLSLRNQSLLHRQLGMLDAMERGARDPAALGDLFRLDHLTTRMRRHAESLIILSGATPGRGWQEPVPALDVLRAAIAEVEDYVRVDVADEPPDAIVGPAVNDVIHLLAELIENAATFSPPSTRVGVRASAVGVGLAVEIEDRGLGLSAAELADVNARLARAPEFDLAGSDQLGIFVVGQLAARHGIRVLLRDSPYGGTTAIVLLPHSIIAGAGHPEPARPDPARPAAGGQRAGAALTGPATGAAADAEGGFAYSPTGRHRVDAVLSGTSPRPEAPARPRPAGPSSSPAEAAGGTHLGLPVRVRQSSLAPQLRGGTGPAAPPPAARPAGDPVVRSPEEARQMMSALQDGWQRGRTDDLEDAGDPPGGWPEGAPGAAGGGAPR